MFEKNKDCFLSDRVDRWITTRSVTKNLSPKTVRDYRNIMNRLLNYLDDKSISLETIEQYQFKLATIGNGKKKWKPSAINAEIKVIKQFIHYLYKNEFIKKDFSKDIELLKENEVDFEVPEVKTLEKIIYAGTEPNISRKGVRGDNRLNVERKKNSRDALLFMLCTGWRLIEVKRLRKDDLYLNSDIPKVRVRQKGGNQKLVPVSTEAVKILRNRMSLDIVFPVTDSHLNHCLKRGCEKLGIKLQTPLTVHSLRRAFGTNLSNNGVNLFLVQKALRHKSIITTQRYIKPNDSQLSKVINGYHDLNREAIQYKDKEQFYLNSLLSMGIDKDEKINFSYYRNEKDELILKISEKTT